MTTNNSKISTLNNPNKKRRQISIPFSGMLKFNLDPHTINLIKLQINKKGFFLKKGLEIHLENTEFRYSFRIPFGFILIIIPNQVVSENFVIAEFDNQTFQDIYSFE